MYMKVKYRFVGSLGTINYIENCFCCCVDKVVIIDIVWKNDMNRSRGTMNVTMMMGFIFLRKI